jgi:predicted DNA-binding protein
MKKIVTSVKVPNDLDQQLSEAVIKDGYGMRGKSRWITEAIMAFLELDDFTQYVDIASEQSHLNKTLSFRMPTELAVRLDAAVIQVRKQYPLMEAARSNIVRASLFQHLLR